MVGHLLQPCYVRVALRCAEAKIQYSASYKLSHTHKIYMQNCQVSSTLAQLPSTVRQKCRRNRGQRFCHNVKTATYDACIV